MPKVKSSFANAIVSIPIKSIVPRREVSEDQRRGVFFRQIRASLSEIGLIEALIVCRAEDGTINLLDGHIRLCILAELGNTAVQCIVATTDEGYTYNRKVNSIPAVAQNVMLLKALESGLSEERIAASLRVNVSLIRKQRRLLLGVCDEVVEILQTKNVSANTFAFLKRMKPIRQIEAAEHMVANGTYSAPFVRALLYASKPEVLISPPQKRGNVKFTEQAREKFAEEGESLLRSLKGLEDDLGREALTLTIFQGYVTRLLKNPGVVRYLKRRHPDILGALQREAPSAA